jgi:hypothetical protein
VQLVNISGKKEKEYLKAKIDEIESNIKIKNIRDLYRSISDFKKRKQLRTNRVKDEKGDLVTDFHSFFLARWRKDFSRLMNVHGFSDVRQTEIRTAKPLVPEPSAFEAGLAIEKLKRHKSPGILQILADLVIGGGGRQFALRSMTY